MASQIQFDVPLLPPSVNHYKKPGRQPGAWFKTPEALAFIEAVCIFSRREAVEGKLFHVSITFHIPRREFLRWDLDNFSKVACDALKAAGVIPDDRYIEILHLWKRSAQSAIDARTAYLVEGRPNP